LESLQSNKELSLFNCLDGRERWESTAAAAAAAAVVAVAAEMDAAEANESCQKSFHSASSSYQWDSSPPSLSFVSMVLASFSIVSPSATKMKNERKTGLKKFYFKLSVASNAPLYFYTTQE
jgi:hypothetical protein